jgi:hypothetical protein
LPRQPRWKRPRWFFSGETIGEWRGFKQHKFEVDGCAAWVVEPKVALPGKPWSWCMEFPNAFTERSRTQLAREVRDRANLDGAEAVAPGAAIDAELAIDLDGAAGGQVPHGAFPLPLPLRRLAQQAGVSGIGLVGVVLLTKRNRMIPSARILLQRPEHEAGGNFLQTLRHAQGRPLLPKEVEKPREQTFPKVVQ